MALFVCLKITKLWQQYHLKEHFNISTYVGKIIFSCSRFILNTRQASWLRVWSVLCGLTEMNTAIDNQDKTCKLFCNQEKTHYHYWILKTSLFCVIVFFFIYLFSCVLIIFPDFITTALKFHSFVQLNAFRFQDLLFVPVAELVSAPLQLCCLCCCLLVVMATEKSIWYNFETFNKCWQITYRTCKLFPDRQHCCLWQW